MLHFCSGFKSLFDGLAVICLVSTNMHDPALLLASTNQGSSANLPPRAEKSEVRTGVFLEY